MIAYNTALQLAQTLLSAKKKPGSTEIREAVDQVLKLPLPDGGLTADDKERLICDLEARFNIWVGTHTILEDQHGHEPWLNEQRADIEWKFWPRYRRYLQECRDYPPNVIRELNRITDSVLGEMEYPERLGRWDRRGMVVGSVQSGKTANYVGLISKAVDSGYRVVIVLAGMMNNLRSQAQVRIDEGFLGFDTRLSMEFQETNQRIGAGSLQGEKFLIANSLTSSNETGDFKRIIAEGPKVVPGGQDPVILVVKKNKSVLENLIAWAKHVQGQWDPQTGKHIIPDIPLLVIDDEADHASVNTADYLDGSGNVDPEKQPRTINRLIRKILDLFAKSIYVGYTATPFANIFIHPDAEADVSGEDLFPRSFIVNLKPPSNYIGPTQVFGLDADPDSGLESVKGLPIIREVVDAHSFIPKKHNKHYVPDPANFPDTLRRAIYSFVLSCAAKSLRGLNKTHCSMLIHVTRFTNVQNILSEIVQSELEYIRGQIEFGRDPKSEKLFDALRDIWETDFVPTSNAVAEQYPDPKIQAHSWGEIESHLHTAALRIEIKTINGTAKDALDYFDHKNGLWTIAIGGEKLSRGLTLEGLSISYFSRTSKMYDTLMQMGRWFGYRPGYLDLCRLYTEPDLVGWYRHIAYASEELRAELDHMVETGSTPTEYGLKVASHQNGMLITASNKMRSAKTMRVSYSGTISESVAFERDPACIAANFSAFQEFLDDLPSEPSSSNGRLIWSDVPGDHIVNLLGAITTHPASWKAQNKPLARYIGQQTKCEELTEWTVVVVSGTGESIDIAGHSVKTVVRNSNGNGNEERYSIGRLVSPSDECIDLTEDERQKALEHSIKLWESGQGKGKNKPKRPSGTAVRAQRSVVKGLFLVYPIKPREIETEEPLIGFAASFPYSEHAEAVEYAVNKVCWDNEFQ